MSIIYWPDDNLAAVRPRQIDLEKPLAAYGLQNAGHSKVDVSIILCTYNRAGLLAQALAYLDAAATSTNGPAGNRRRR